MDTMTTVKNGTSAAQDAGSGRTWRIDAAASRVGFSVGKRLMFVKRLTVTGRFTDVSGTITLDDREPAMSSAEVTIGVASVDTQNARRDKHLGTADFFDAARFPNITFASRRIEAVDRAAGQYRVTGDLTVHGVTREVTLDARYTAPQAGGREPRITLALTGTLNRRDFGIVWNKAAINVKDTITLALDVVATRG